MSSSQYGTTMMAPIAEKFSVLDPNGFREEVQKAEQATQQIRETIVEQVEHGLITPYQGAAVISAVAGHLTGTWEFHRELRPADLALLAQSVGNGS